MPRAGEQIGPEKKDEAFTYRWSDDGAPSRELEDVLVGVHLRSAKERFESRKSDDAEEVFHDQEERGEDLGDDWGRSGSEDMQTSEDEERARKPVDQEISEPPPAKKRMKPVVSADDERSRALLLPAVRHTLSKLDELLMALHHARKTCRRYSHSDAGTADEQPVPPEAVSETAPPPKRAPGRPRKFENLPSRSKLDSVGVPEPGKANAEDLLPAKPKRRGRPVKVYERLQDESEHDYLVRVAKIQKRAIPAITEPPKPETAPSPPARRAAPRRRMRSERARSSRQEGKLGLRDWSEVLGMAALVGFPEDVVERAANRCANLFGEGMNVRRILEVPFPERKKGDTIVAYRPEVIPPFPRDINGSSTPSDSDSISGEDEPALPHISLTGTSSVLCPVPGCAKERKGFVDVAALKRHLEVAHEIQKADFDDWILPSDEEMEGAVHVDGFLRPVKRVRILRRGAYKKKKGSRNRDGLSSGIEDEGEQAGVYGEEEEEEEARSEQAERSEEDGGEEETRSSVDSGRDDL